jgi:hypothetical protein
MVKSWGEMTYHEKLETLRQEITRLRGAISALTRNEDETWEGIRAIRSELAKITKDIATLKSLWPRNYSRAS